MTPFLVIGPSVDGRDRWAIGIDGKVKHCWSMPKWLSFGRYFSTVNL